MRAHYAYEIATRGDNGGWRVVMSSWGIFTRDPRATARSLLERWINDHLGQLPGGRVYVFECPKDPEPAGIVGDVRVRIYNNPAAAGSRPLAAAYLGHHERDDANRRRAGRLRRWLDHRRPATGCGGAPLLI